MEGLHQIHQHLEKHGHDLSVGGEVPLSVINELSFSNDIKKTWRRLQEAGGDAGSLSYKITRATLLKFCGEKITLSKKPRVVRVYPGLTCHAKRARYKMKEKLQQAGVWLEEEHGELTRAKLEVCYTEFAAQKYMMRMVIIPPMFSHHLKK